MFGIDRQAKGSRHNEENVGRIFRFTRLNHRGQSISSLRFPGASVIAPPLDPQIRRSIDEAGFDLVGVTPAVSLRGFDRLVNWIDAGYAGEMDYLAGRLDAYRHPRGVLDGCRTLVAMSLPYPASSDHPGRGGKVARYVWGGSDYHDVVHDRLRPIRREMAIVYPSANVRGVVDTAPLLEREVAAAAGLGWRGKNTLLLSKSRGSYFLLAFLLLNIELQSDAPERPFAPDASDGHCGTCTACLDACPTDAFVSPGVLNASRCISYLTIEHRGQIAGRLRDDIGDWIFGCDVCQEVCPWNRRRGRETIAKDPPPLSRIDPVALFDVDEDEFRRRYRRTPLWRTRRRGMLRNAAIVIGNTDPPGGVEALHKGLVDDEPIVRGASVWALAKLSTRPPRDRLTMQRLKNMSGDEADTDVLAEIDAAVARIEFSEHALSEEGSH